MTRVFAIVSAVLGAIVLGVTLLAIQEKPAPADKQPPQMSMGDMMKGCREHCQATAKLIDQLNTSLRDAKASNDVNKMRVAIDQAQKPLTEMKEHMTMCMNMMNMMEKMHGKDMK
jgi:outer membrane murein-binding lipoprotein Lpp